VAHIDFIGAGLLVMAGFAMFWSERRGNVLVFGVAATLFVLAAIFAFVLLVTGPGS
jgi:hypothetical protein